MIINAKENLQRFENIVLNSGFAGQKIYADYISGQTDETNSFYITDNCAFMISGVNLTLCGNPDEEEFEEIKVFCNFCHVKSIETQLENLPLILEKRLHIMEFAGESRDEDIDIVVNNDIYSFIKFCCANFEDLSFSIVYSNFARKINSGVSDIYYLKEDNKIVSGAIATRYGNDSEYITFVSTLPEYRHKGLAAKVLNYIINNKKDKKIILKCEPALNRFYEKLGFKSVGSLILYKVF